MRAYDTPEKLTEYFDDTWFDAAVERLRQTYWSAPTSQRQVVLAQIVTRITAYHPKKGK